MPDPPARPPHHPPSASPRPHPHLHPPPPPHPTGECSLPTSLSTRLSLAHERLDGSFSSRAGGTDLGAAASLALAAQLLPEILPAAGEAAGTGWGEKASRRDPSVALAALFADGGERVSFPLGFGVTAGARPPLRLERDLTRVLGCA